MEIELNYKDKKEILKAKKQNAKIFTIYKMFSWDLLFFYSIQYLFFTVTKEVSPGDILKITAFYPLLMIIMQLPAIICGDLLGRKKSIILGNLFVVLYILDLIFLPGRISLFVGNIFFAFGYSLKNIQETNLLYDSTSTRGGEGLYSKINAAGAGGYYIIDGIASLIAGYLFVINGYLPIYICLFFSIVALILSFRFKDIYKNNIEEKNSMINKIKEYQMDLKESVKAIIKSKRLRALILFIALFNTIIEIIQTYKGNILVELKISPEMFSIINSILTLIAGLTATFQNKFHKTFRNKSLMLLAILCTTSIILMGILMLKDVIYVLPITLVLLSIINITMSIFFILSEKYLKNFSTPKTRGRISFASELVTNLIKSVGMYIAGIVLEIMSIGNATMWTGIVFLIIFVFTLSYMKTRVGLKPEEYNKNDIEI